jgi:hypothetical protein
MLNYSEMLRLIHVDPTTGHAVWAGARTAIERDAYMIAATAAAPRPMQWIDERSVDPDFARHHPLGWGI